MDNKDLELLATLNSHGRWDIDQIGDRIGISPGNVSRRIRLMKKEGILEGFSAFLDRRMFGYDTSYLKSHMDVKGRDKTLGKILSMPQVASVYPNMDDFALVEVIHWDMQSLESAIRAVERITKPMTVSAVYTPRFPDVVPDPPKGRELKILLSLVTEGRITSEKLGGEVGIDPGQVEESIRRMMDSGIMRIKPLLREGLIQPCPCFTILVWLDECSDIGTATSSLLKLAKGRWDHLLFDNPSGIWIKFFGEDLFAMDHSLERLRREKNVDDLMVIMPDGVEYDRKPDINLLKRYMKSGPEGEMGLL